MSDDVREKDLGSHFGTGNREKSHRISSCVSVLTVDMAEDSQVKMLIWLEFANISRNVADLRCWTGATLFVAFEKQ